MPETTKQAVRMLFGPGKTLCSGNTCGGRKGLNCYLLGQKFYLDHLFKQIMSLDSRVTLVLGVLFLPHQAVGRL